MPLAKQFYKVLLQAPGIGNMPETPPRNKQKGVKTDVAGLILRVRPYKIFRRFPYSPLLFRPDCVSGFIKAFAFFDFDKNQQFAAADNQVNFSGAGSPSGNIIARRNPKTVQTIKQSRHIFGKTAALIIFHF